MSNNKLICFRGGSGRLTEKKSEFISDVFPVQSEKEALECLESVKKKYWDARHHCYAYILSGNPQTKKFSDDGEPSQTAGKPILGILESTGVENCIIIVTRYFGGKLLGTGGLVRAYSGAAKAGLDACELCEVHEGSFLRYRIDYDLYGKIQKCSENGDFHIYGVDFSDKVCVNLAMDKTDADNIINKVTELSTGKAFLEDREDREYIIRENKVIGL